MSFVITANDLIQPESNDEIICPVLSTQKVWVLRYQPVTKFLKLIMKHAPSRAYQNMAPRSTCPIVVRGWIYCISR